ncbi:hypothetical protein HYS94_01555 [Candidatus Daviesbacteria bacterium]|nr:hypothetical protein [Candidatus Daviesbacteria bacterium]
MPLDVNLLSNAITYRLQADSVTISYNRFPVVNPTGAATQPILFDLGQFVTMIRIEGRINETSSTDSDAATIQNKTALEDAVGVADWNTTQRLTVSGDTYLVKIRSLVFKLEGSLEDRWQFTLELTGQGRGT